MSSEENHGAVVYLVENKREDHETQSDSGTWLETQWRPILAEFVSTIFLMLFGCMSCIPVEGLNHQVLILSSLGFGLTVMFNIQIFGYLSGAHMNPAVTLSAIIWGSLSIKTGVAYFVVQCIGSIIGYGILIGVTSRNVSSNAICVASPSPDINQFQALGIEILLTVVLVFVCCAIWDPVNKNKQDSVPIKFGLVVTVLSIIGGPWTGAAMNPARALGPAVWSQVWTKHWIYWVGPTSASVIATLFYKIMFIKKLKSVL